MGNVFTELDLTDKEGLVYLNEKLEVNNIFIRCCNDKKYYEIFTIMKGDEVIFESTNSTELIKKLSTMIQSEDIIFETIRNI